MSFPDKVVDIGREGYRFGVGDERSAVTDARRFDHEHSLDLRGSGPQALSRVRRWLTSALSDLGRDHVADIVQATDELASNAYEHGGGLRAVRVRCTRHPCSTTVEIEDSNLDQPVLGRSRFGETARRGRGLVLVERLARAWGVREQRAHGTKTVWVEVECDEQPCATQSTEDSSGRRADVPRADHRGVADQPVTRLRP